MLSLVNSTKKTLKYNPTVDEMYKSAVVCSVSSVNPQGPEAPFHANPLASGENNVTTGYVEVSIANEY